MKAEQIRASRELAEVAGGLVPHESWFPGMPRRRALYLAKSGKVRGAVLIGNSWYATPQAIRDFLATCKVAP